MKTGKEFYEMLSVSEKIKFKKNVKDFQYEMNRTEYSFKVFLSGAFTWHKTVENHSYWEKIALKY